MVYCSSCDKELDVSAFDAGTGRQNFRKDDLERFCRSCRRRIDSSERVGNIYGFFDGDTCVYVGYTVLVDWKTRIREHEYCSRAFPDVPFYAKVPELGVRYLQQCHPDHALMYEYAWQLQLAPEDRELPLYNQVRSYCLPSRGLYRLEYADSSIVIHFDEPLPWPWPRKCDESVAFLRDAKALKDYLFGRLDVPQQPIKRPCSVCGETCKNAKECPMSYLWEWAGGHPYEDPSIPDIDWSKLDWSVLM